jgi:hypothetical protein
LLGFMASQEIGCPVTCRGFGNIWKIKTYLLYLILSNLIVALGSLPITSMNIHETVKKA